MTDESLSDSNVLTNIKISDVLINITLCTYVKKILADLGYELVLPPDDFKEGDEFLSDGHRWKRVTKKTHVIRDDGRRYSQDLYIIRRKNERQKMIDFFFKSRNND